MKKILWLVSGVGVAVAAAHLFWGYSEVYSVIYGTICIYAALIAATFYWQITKLWSGLAVGMALSWTGTSGVMGWWWLYGELGQLVISI